MDSSSQDKNLPATERKLQQARKDGQASRSKDLSHLAVLGTDPNAISRIPTILTPTSEAAHACGAPAAARLPRARSAESRVPRLRAC